MNIQETRLARALMVILDAMRPEFLAFGGSRGIYLHYSEHGKTEMVY